VFLLSLCVVYKNGWPLKTKVSGAHNTIVKMLVESGTGGVWTIASDCYLDCAREEVVYHNEVYLMVE
jgi:hypothetical protein